MVKPERIFSNPFQVTKPVDSQDIIDREEAVDKLLALAEEGNNARVVAPRRFGKTSIIRRAQDDLARSGEWETVYVDLLGVTTLQEVTARIERAYVACLKGPLARWFTGLRQTWRPSASVGGGVVPLSGSVELTVRTQSLVERLALPVAVHTRTGRRVHVVFDEFQEIDELDVPVDGIIRSEIQHHGAHASYVFAGSSISMMEMLFTDRKRAFYGQSVPVSVPVVPDDRLAEYVYERFDATHKALEDRVMAALLGLVRGHPQRAMVAAHYLWEATERTGDVEQWEVAYRALMEDQADEMKTLWFGLSRSDRLTLANIASGKGPYAGGRSGGAAKASLDSLAGSGMIRRIERGFVVVDPLLERWVLEQRD